MVGRVVVLPRAPPKSRVSLHKDIILVIVRCEQGYQQAAAYRPKAIADQYGIRPGDELQWMPSGDSIRIELGGRSKAGASLTLQERIDLFDKGTERLNKIRKQAARQATLPATRSRGWAREDLYNRGFPR